MEQNIRYFKIITVNSFVGEKGIWLHIINFNQKYVRLCKNLNDFKNIKIPEREGEKIWENGFNPDDYDSNLKALTSSLGIYKEITKKEAIICLKNKKIKVSKWKAIWKNL